ncbi:MAG: LysR family transcriptional regulator [Thiolinea sp.]
MPTRRIPSLNWLRVFEASARHQSFVRAAEELGMSAAAVSQQIKALETHLKKSLFSRKAHSIELTAVGRAFLTPVQQSLNQMEVSAAGLFGNPRREPLSIRVVLLFANGWLAERLADFQQSHPDIHLQIYTSNTYPLPQGQEYDMEVVFGVGLQYGQEGDLLFREYTFPVALPEISANIQCINDLLQYRLINLSEHHTGWMQVFSHQPDTLLTEAEFIFADNTTTALSFAASGLGIALARMPASDGLQQRLGLEPCLKNFTIPNGAHYYLTYPSAEGLSRAAKTFRVWLLDNI